MTTNLEISSVFGKAILETDKSGGLMNVKAPAMPNRYESLDKLEVKSIRLDFSENEKWNFSFRFLPSSETEISADSGQWLDAYCLETGIAHGHIAFRGDDWWMENNFTEIATRSTKFGCDYICEYMMRSLKNHSIDFALAFASNNSPSTADDVETWLAVDHLLPQNGYKQNA